MSFINKILRINAEIMEERSMKYCKEIVKQGSANNLETKQQNMLKDDEITKFYGLLLNMISRHTT
jgi:hypothetical protein